MKQESVRTYKPKVWRKFSTFRRMQDARERGDGTYVKCCTCNKIDMWKNMHAGHFLPRQSNSTYFMRENVHNQCKQCNFYKHGNPATYSQFIIEKYGQEFLQTLMTMKDKPHRWTLESLKEIYDDSHTNIKAIQKEDKERFTF